ncbi:hypothetical protein HYDPIDRAFT_188405 [Hydnomerulius pinastri MD-312]|uniref:Uncharacterized protein n=1 Tax=Hydnomerulius pinastri MD-312 TaxID=994086 RepID=A0A0C9VZ09_9AGAM|nr:hypothetical protein HYDPIDRAFT_188405 [Hydnomerulius pinastri MD-312]
MNDFFTRNKDVDRTDLAKALRHKCTFTYQDMDNPVKEEAFRSVFVLQLLATGHIHAVIGHVDVPSLNTKKLALCGVSGAVSVSCAALERAILCMHDGVIDSDILADKNAQPKRKPKTPKAFNEATGKESTTKYAFSCTNWKSATLGYYQSVSARGDTGLQVITSMARNVLLIRGADSVEKYLGESHGKSSDEMDERAML